MDKQFAQSHPLSESMAALHREEGPSTSKAQSDTVGISINAKLILHVKL